MEKLSIAICEDSPEDRRCMESALESAGIPCACDWFENGESFLEGFSYGKYDLVLLDVYMGEMTGVEVARLVRETDSDVMLAFVTTSEDFAMEGYRSRVERYLLKPYQENDVHEILASAARRVESQQEAALTVAGETIPISRIRYAEQNNHTTIIYLMGGNEVRRTGRLDDIDSQLPSPPFYRSHKSYLVNLDHVKRLDRNLNAFEMDSGEYAYIRRASVREAQRMYEARLIERTKALG
jgi:DNA-binding LytR/AlgR family response regulator